MREYELIDRVDYDCHDTGSREDMQREADARNVQEGERRWVVKPVGFSEANYRG